MGHEGGWWFCHQIEHVGSETGWARGKIMSSMLKMMLSTDGQEASGNSGVTVWRPVTEQVSLE